jgi:hypothetical protein
MRNNILFGITDPLILSILWRNMSPYMIGGGQAHSGIVSAIRKISRFLAQQRETQGSRIKVKGHILSLV